MGGFRLLGPNYTIQSLRTEVMCKCMGYKGQVSEEVENILVNHPEKKLDPTLINSKSAHLGETMCYKVIHRSEDPDFDKEREQFKAKKKAKAKKRVDYENWTPWDGKSLESISTREMEPIEYSIFKWDRFNN